MNTFETITTVEENGQVHVAGVPFEAGTEVAVRISPKSLAADEVSSAEETALAAARERMRELFKSVKGFRNSPRIPREDLYERGRVH